MWASYQWVGLGTCGGGFWKLPEVDFSVEIKLQKETYTERERERERESCIFYIKKCE